MRTFREQNCFCTITLYFNWFNFLSVESVDISFQSTETGKYAIPTRHLNFHFAPLAVSYELSDGEIKDNWISSRLNPTVYSSSLRKKSSSVTSGKIAAKRPLCGWFWDGWHMLHTRCTWLHYVHFENRWKCLAERLLVLQTRILHHALVEGGKGNPERCC